MIRNTRYVALEFGIHGWKPYRAHEVVSRGFGDCKDKGSLINAVLAAAGIEARVVLLRTWGNPLATVADRTFVGAEVRTSLTGVVNVGTGYYWPVSGDDGDRGGFWGFHVGVGA